MRALMYLAVLGGLLLIAGCSSASDKATENKQAKEQDTESHALHTLPNGDLQETTASAEEMPNFLKDKEEQMQSIYLAAAQNPEVLQFMPCYCGCGESAGHKSNLNCFVGEIKEDKVVWDDHGTRCGVCLEIAAESVLMHKEGKALKEIRKYIDQKYQQGYAKPTPTPMPA
ncbi:PCYCGC motif-containing (lipo)protein [Bacillus xiapuensis]|uniref:PCYCGC motif-containing (lipo)protein n=1 Tax=Bacillus xiapuensis TaxID=2014075 RepID=UPI000C244224|nr:PCYCGC motif-containing (lipo)protein [Bacillus xiapuensis]